MPSHDTNTPETDGVRRPTQAGPAPAGVDPEAAAAGRMAAIRQRLIQAVPTWTAGEVADRLGVTEAALQTMRDQRRALAVDVDGELHYPVFQFGFGDADGIRPVMREVIGALDEVPVANDWARLDLLTAPDAAEDDRRSVAELLRDGETDQALAVIRNYGETGGGPQRREPLAARDDAHAVARGAEVAAGGASVAGQLDGPCEMCGQPGWAEPDPDDPNWRPVRCGEHQRDAGYT